MIKTLFIFAFCFLLSAVASHAATVASDGSDTDVQAKHDAGASGDTITMPNGTYDWSSGVVFTKQIFLQALNYTPTPAGTAGAGTSSRNVTITHNASADLFTYTSGNTFHGGLVGIRINQGTGTGSILRLTGSGTKPPFIKDCYIEVEPRFGGGNQIIDCTGLLGGLMWNSILFGTGDPNSVGEGPFLLKESPRAWATASTMGTNDVGGLVNFYVEDSTFVGLGNCPDIDDNGRYVMRHSIMDGTWAETHGFSSTYGGRHFEFYDMTFKITMEERNMAGRFFWCRAGTGIFADIVTENAPDVGFYSAPDVLNIGDTSSPTTYPQNRQPGGGHNGSSYVIDPIYMWNHSGPRAYEWGLNGSWGDNVQLDRDIFVNDGAKPGYTKFTYPHPLRSVLEGGSDTTDPTVAIDTPTSAATYSTPNAALTVSGTASDDTAVTSVTWSNDRGGSGSATGTTSWSKANIPLFAGVNVITITAADAAANDATDVITVTRTLAEGTITSATIGTLRVKP